MANITVRNVPNDVFEMIRKLSTIEKRSVNSELLEEFLLSVEIIQPDLSILKRFGQLKGDLRNQGLLLPDADILIAATAFEKARLLVTGNKIENRDGRSGFCSLVVHGFRRIVYSPLKVSEAGRRSGVVSAPVCSLSSKCISL
jgi:hypothetical protein